MEHKKYRNILSSNTITTIFHTWCACFMGYIIWNTWNKNTYITYTDTFSVYLYNHEAEIEHINAPEKMSVTIGGPRHQCQKYFLKKKHGIHIDLGNAHFKNHTYTHFVSASDIFLPDSLKLLYCSPVIIKSTENSIS